MAGGPDAAQATLPRVGAGKGAAGKGAAGKGGTVVTSGVGGGALVLQREDTPGFGQRRAADSRGLALPVVAAGSLAFPKSGLASARTPRQPAELQRDVQEHRRRGGLCGGVRRTAALASCSRGWVVVEDCEAAEGQLEAVAAAHREASPLRAPPAVGGGSTLTTPASAGTPVKCRRTRCWGGLLRRSVRCTAEATIS